jgi:hypothetical protein
MPILKNFVHTLHCIIIIIIFNFNISTF